MSDSVFLDLDQTLEFVWSKLTKVESVPPVVLATSSECGASARMVVLRAANREAQGLEIWCHAKSRKINELISDPHAEILVWLADRQLQIRIKTKIEVSEGSNGIWDTLGKGSRLNYAQFPSAGETISNPETSAPVPDVNLFRVLNCHVLTIETLWLGGMPHRRAVFDGNSSIWIAP
ncbi:MAG: pyridoxamine 5'-phosphate oxidase family protein [Boseongicola sp.]|nr:pyridoxamine 5'-phosphate oxidase family protein [Boseongicola sp.]